LNSSTRIVLAIAENGLFIVQPLIKDGLYDENVLFLPLGCVVPVIVDHEELGEEPGNVP